MTTTLKHSFIKNFNIYNESLINEKYKKIFTITDINIIEYKINNVLDKFSEKCKYYINYSDTQPYYCVSFILDNYDNNNIQIMIKTSFEIYIYKNIDNKAVVVLSDGINNHPEWKDVKKSLKLEL